ncbi:MAG TPA: non-heme iron oxygenase ferredoxin subunit [Terriglobales bacterium]|nr:non-heme iron oxygenase ferredoxin subunit [Terriglobales bacterium]
MAKFIRVCQTADVTPGSGKSIEVNGSAIALFNIDGTYYAIDDTCRHRGGPLGEGELDGKVVVCPWHGWRYDVTTGANELVPEQPAQTYEVKVEGEEVFVAV